MEMQFFTFRGATLAYTKSGNGPHTCLTFHGFGQSHRAFDKFSQSFENQYTVISFDLFFHGESKWPEVEKPIEKAYWKELISAFLSALNIKKCDVIGYSIGARFALATLEALPHSIESITLIAPDGIQTNFWYYMATQPLVTRRLFKSMIYHPNRFQALALFAHKIRVIDTFVLRFAQSQMNSEFKRNQVYYSWVVFRHLQFSIATIASLINTHKIAIHLVIGRNDKIIQSKKVKQFVSKLNNPDVQIIESAHHDLINQWTLSLIKK